ncbi:cupin 2 conserved barrel domain-containing protein [Emericellopsis cladophorae]|uniref:Cupin 2 conserved barrel domain-containing protein n=1 Tax=Emericellopsis cladophorae TaxID=2686198 RepID=A0A9P9XUW2_9HYPO|nr:cupin 2 conserved barrel domain-containing protein [Emericellopsis cladophorae]KAI6778257.1 cupin 2 conserved barrel domain-containing protein [Emericellopsis cladophorae]
MPAVSVPSTLNSFTETWSPRLIASVNGQHVKIAKCDGAFIFHSHPDSEELFYLLSGRLTMEIEGDADNVVMSPGDVYVVPRGVRHRPVCENAEIMMVEKAGTVNTGDAPAGERTRVPVNVTQQS